VPDHDLDPTPTIDDKTMPDTDRTHIPTPLVTTAWLADNLHAADLRIIDCSVVMRTTDEVGYTFIGGAEEWRTGHVPGSVFVDVLTQLAAKDHPLPMMMPAPEEFAATMAALGVADESRVVLYDRSNHAWAARVWWMLRYCGFDRAAVLDGGWNKWSAEGMPTSTEASTYPVGELTVNVRSRLFAAKQEVIAAMRASGICIVNSLSPEEHSGATSRFPRAGRIPGSTNVYCQSLVDTGTHAYLPRQALRERFDSAGALSSARVITYCGAGIAASSDALALTLLGHGDVAVYDGSLAEWTSDPDVPMETG
jgi:thiosulfate/3-mercaptopyruvate sulfurtransferase